VPLIVPGEFKLKPGGKLVFKVKLIGPDAAPVTVMGKE
jgi:hypothetical protein